MALITADLVSLQATAADKEDAIRKAGALLVEAGCVAPAYVDGMLAREETMSTYLGEGVAIPHGQYDNLDDIYKTGISVLQLSTGVEWEPDEIATLIIGIAASSDEHVGVLSNLAEAIEDEDVLEELNSTTDVNVVLQHLGTS